MKLDNLQNGKKNIRLYPIYKMLSYDYLFFYAIRFLFLTQTKQIVPSDVILATSLYAIFRAILQVPAVIIIDKMGRRNSLMVGNVSNCIFLVLILFCSNLQGLILAQLFSAIAFAIKGVAEQGLLNASIPESDRKSKMFAQIDGAGLSYYYYVNAATALVSGFLFTINGYIPIVLSLLFSIVAVVLTTKFEKLKTHQEEMDKNIKPVERIKEYFKDLKISFRFIFTSRRLKGLILFSGILWGIIALYDNYEVNLIEQMGVSAQSIGIIFAVLGIVSGLASKMQDKFHHRFRNKSLSVMALSHTIACMIAGLCVVCRIPFAPAIAIVLVCYAVRYADYGMYNVLVRRYLGNFASSDMTTKIYAADNLLSNVMKGLIGIMGAGLLNSMPIEYAVAITGGVFTLVMLMVLGYMKGKVGLKPEQYNKKDIECKVLK